MHTLICVAQAERGGRKFIIEFAVISVVSCDTIVLSITVKILQHNPLCMRCAVCVCVRVFFYFFARLVLFEFCDRYTQQYAFIQWWVL